MSRSAKVFLALVYGWAIVQVAYAASVIVLLSPSINKAGNINPDTLCANPEEEQCYNPRNAKAFAAPLIVGALTILGLVTDAILTENSVQLILSIAAQCCILLVVFVSR